MRRVVRLLFPLALALVTAPLPAHARHPLPRLPGPWETAASQGSGRDASLAFERALSTPGLTLERFRGMRRDFLVAPKSQRGAGLVPATSADEVSIPIRSGDLTGDGYDDMLTADLLANGVKITARHGNNGSAIWSTDLGDDGYLATSDVDGDHITDVLLLSFADSDLGNDGPIASAKVISSLQNLRILNGKTGAVRWQTDIVGTYVVAAGDASPALYGELDAVHNVIASVQFGFDATGDGLGDVFVGTIDGASQTAAVPAVALEADAGRFSSTYLGGTNGSSIATSSAVGSGIIPFTWPVDDLSGDRRADLLTVDAPLGDYEIRASDTAGSSLWSKQVPGAVVPYGLDMTGDGRTEVIVEAVPDNYNETVYVYDAFGREVWHRAIGRAFLLPAQLDTDGGWDFVVTLLPADGDVARLEGVAGETGQDIWAAQKEVTVPDGYYGVIAICDCPDDLSGDGRTDVLFASLIFTPDFTLDTQSVSEVTGTSGDTVWTAALLRSDRLPIPIYADADGDGGGDLLSGRLVRTVTSRSARISVRSGSSYATVFAQSLPVLGESFGIYVEFGANVADTPAAELVLDYFDGYRTESIYTLGPAGTLWAL